MHSRSVEKPASRRSRKIVSSYGLICHRLRIDFDSREVYPEFLAIQRKDTISFVEFIRGKYAPDDLDYVRKLISTMTLEEQMAISSETFPHLWASFWGLWRRSPNCNCESSFKTAMATYDNLVLACGDTGLRGLVAQVGTVAPEQEWSFPKGRKMQTETDLSCALREFEEETGFRQNCVHVFDMPSYEEVFDGGNGILYRHVYFLCRLVDMRNPPPCTPPAGSVRSRETRNMQWFDFADACDKFRNAPTRVELLARANRDIVSILAPGMFPATK